MGQNTFLFSLFFTCICGMDETILARKITLFCSVHLFHKLNPIWLTSIMFSSLHILIKYLTKLDFHRIFHFAWVGSCIFNLGPPARCLPQWRRGKAFLMFLCLWCKISGVNATALVVVTRLATNNLHFLMSRRQGTVKGGEALIYTVLLKFFSFLFTFCFKPIAKRR